MVRTCTVCTHPERQAIDKALVGVLHPYRTIADQYGLSHQSLLRHKADHLLETIKLAWQEERAQNGRELGDTLLGWMETIDKLLAACREWLTDPDDPTRFTLEPHTTEVVIHTERERGPNRPPERRKMRLSRAIALVDGDERVGDVVLVESKVADPRKLILDATKTLEGHLRLLAEIEGKIATQGTVNFLATPEWSALEARMLAALALYPAARLALADVLSEGGEGDADRA